MTITNQNSTHEVITTHISFE